LGMWCNGLKAVRFWFCLNPRHLNGGCGWRCDVSNIFLNAAVPLVPEFSRMLRINGGASSARGSL
jgi:hypothetical protein